MSWTEIVIEVARTHAESLSDALWAQVHYRSR